MNQSNSVKRSLPPPHPSKFSQRRTLEPLQESKNQDLKISYESRQNDFLTVGKNSHIQPHNRDRASESQSSFYPAVNRNSEKIYKKYKTRSHNEENLEESYHSVRSRSRSQQRSRSRSRSRSHRSCSYTPDRNHRSNGHHEMVHHHQRYSPANYSTGNILEQIEDESIRPAVVPQSERHCCTKPDPHISVVENNTNSLQDAIREYIEKCRHLENELAHKDHVIHTLQSEAHRTQSNMERLQDELIHAENHNQDYRENTTFSNDKINELTRTNHALQLHLTNAEEKIKELSDSLKSEKHFNSKIADNLALQTRESSNFKTMGDQHHAKIQDLTTEIERLSKIVHTKNDQLEQMQGDKIQNGNKIKELAKRLDEQASKNEKLEEKIKQLEAKNENLSQQVLEKTKEINDINEDLEGKDDFLKKSKEQISALKDKADILDIKNRELIGKNTALEKSNIDLDKENQQLLENVEQLQDEIEQREEEHVKFELEVSEKLEHYKQLNRKLDELYKKMEEKDQEIIMLKAMEYDNVFSDTQLDDMKVKFKKLEQERYQLQIQADKLEKDNQLILKEKQDIKKEMEYLQMNQGDRINEFDMKFQLLKQDHQVLKEENNDLKEKVKELKREISLTEKSRDIFREECLELKKNSKEQKEQLEKMDDLKKSMYELQKSQETSISSYAPSLPPKANPAKEITSSIQTLIKQYRDNKK